MIILIIKILLKFFDQIIKNFIYIPQLSMNFGWIIYTPKKEEGYIRKKLEEIQHYFSLSYR